MLPSAAVTVAARPSPLARAWAARWPIGVELVLFLVLMVVYEWLRDLVAVDDPDRAPAARPATSSTWRRPWACSSSPTSRTSPSRCRASSSRSTWLYTLAHTTGFAVMFLGCGSAAARYYAAFRNWFWITNGAGDAWATALYPLAPPRLTDLGLEDPTKATLELGGALSWFQPFRNEFAAMPSMHVGYALLFALTIFWLQPGLALALAGASCGRRGCCSWSCPPPTTGGSTAVGGAAAVLLALRSWRP